MTQAPLHSVWFVGHAQVAPVQEAPVAQAWPHDPQFAGSVASDVHDFPHANMPAVHGWQAPAPHLSFDAQRVPQAPQFRGSDATSTQAPVHRTIPAPQSAGPSGPAS